MVVDQAVLIRPRAVSVRLGQAVTFSGGAADGSGPALAWQVVTAGGILGRVTKVNENYVTLEVAEGTEITVQKNAVTTVLPKGSLKSL